MKNRYLKRTLLPAASLCLSALLISTPVSAIPKEFPPLPQVELKTNVRGEEAIKALGNKLPGVAAHHGKSAEELKKALKEDHTLWVDKNGHLYYVEEPLPSKINLINNKAADQISIPLDQTFLLHSLPGASKVIYLDFDGNIVFNPDGSVSTVSPPYDTEGDTSTLSDQEKQSIIDIWKQVAEDFIIFNIDVTTEDPGLEALRKTSTDDENYGVRVVIGGSSFDWYGASAGGIAFIGSFNWDTDVVGFGGNRLINRAYVFPDQLGNGYSKFVAEAASHEAGHTLGLLHDGILNGAEYYDGRGSWAPIMGVAYSMPISQWSKGEYANANNMQDDLAVMQDYGPEYRADDHGNDISTATLLQAHPHPDPHQYHFEASGIIEKNIDKDVFSFEAGPGMTNIVLIPGEIFPDLDASLTLYDNNHNILAVTNLTGEGGAGIETLNYNIIDPGTYYISVDGVGTGDPLINGFSDYASLGQYTITGSAYKNTPFQAPTAIANAAPLFGLAPLTVKFSSANSFDSDGTIVSYFWDFGDGTSSILPDPQHVYFALGHYIFNLDVTDNDGLHSSTHAAVDVLPPFIYVDQISLRSNTKKTGTDATAHVVVKDNKGKRVHKAKVTGSWSGIVTSPQQTSSSKGIAKFTSPPTNATQGIFTFTVDNITANGLVYYSPANIETTDSISR